MSLLQLFNVRLRMIQSRFYVRRAVVRDSFLRAHTLDPGYNNRIDNRDEKCLCFGEIPANVVRDSVLQLNPMANRCDKDV